MFKKVLIAVVVIIIVLAGVWYYQNNKPVAPVSGESIKIGISTMLSGNWSSLGDNIVMAAKLAVEDINKSGGINGRAVELVIQDSGLDSKTGLAAAQKLINTDGVKYIIGGTSSNGTMAAAPLVNEKKVVYITPVTGGTNIDNAGEYIFRTANSDLLAGRDLALAALKLNYKKVAVVSEVTEYTLDIEKTFQDTLSGQGGVVAVSEQFQPGTTDFRTIVAKVKASNPDAILILSQTGVSGAHFIKQAKEAGVVKPLLSDFTFVANADAQKIVGSFEGIYFADPAYGSDKSKTKTFFARYEKTFGSPSVIPFHAASTYDSVMMLADALRASGDDSVKVHDWLLSNVKNWQGLMGVYSLDSNGNSDLGFVIKTVKNGQFVKLEE